VNLGAVAARACRAVPPPSTRSANRALTALVGASGLTLCRLIAIRASVGAAFSTQSAFRALARGLRGR
jgi:hypothetical protein